MEAISFQLVPPSVDFCHFNISPVFPLEVNTISEEFIHCVLFPLDIEDVPPTEGANAATDKLEIPAFALFPHPFLATTDILLLPFALEGTFTTTLVVPSPPLTIDQELGIVQS